MEINENNLNKYIENIGTILNNSNEPLKKRFRALFTLRNLKNEKSIELINHVILNDENCLLKHECCYCLGQMNNKNAIKYLIDILNNLKEDQIVRHESAEALCNLAETEDYIINILNKYCQDESIIVKNTCQIAFDFINWRKNEKPEIIKYLDSLNLYSCKDPAPCFDLKYDLNFLKTILYDKNSRLFDKYRCLFSLRNRGKLQHIKLLGESLLKYQNDKEMVLLKHEICYIFGQMQSFESVIYLKKILEDLNEHEIVRHEAAEALGSISTSNMRSFLEKYINDESKLVRDSIEVALDMLDYENDVSQFNFIANNI